MGTFSAGMIRQQMITLEDTEVMDKIIENIKKERRSQYHLWGEQNHQDNRWLPILVEEVGEVATAVFDKSGKEGWTPIREELLHVAAVAIAWIECIDRRRESEET